MIPQLRAIAKAERMFLTPFSFCHFSLAVRSWTEKCGKLLLWIPSVFSAAPSLSLFFNGTVTTIQSHCPLPLNVYLKTSPFPYVAHWEKRWRKKRNDKKNKRQGEREREKSLPQECLIKASYRQRPRIPLGRTHSHSQQTNASALSFTRTHTHTHTHTITVSAHVYHIAAYIKANYVASH